jgi:hypothetical protein
MYKNLISEIAIRKIAKTDIATALSVSRDTLENKLRGITDFKVSEAVFIHEKFFPDLDYQELFQFVVSEDAK